MPKVDVNLPLVLYQPICISNLPVNAGKTVAEFKKEINSNLSSYSPNIKEFGVVLKTLDNDFITLKEDGVFDNRLAEAKEIALYSKEPYCTSQPVTEKKNNPCTFFDLLPNEKLHLKIKEKLASRLVTCFGDFWESIFYELDMTDSAVSIEFEDSKKNVYRAATKLLMKWAHRCGSGATLKVFLEHLVTVDKYGMTTIDWEKIKRILEDYS